MHILEDWKRYQTQIGRRWKKKKKASQRRRWPNCAVKLSAVMEQRLGNPRDREVKFAAYICIEYESSNFPRATKGATTPLFGPLEPQDTLAADNRVNSTELDHCFHVCPQRDRMNAYHA